jgi:hypothetical protein
MAAADEERTNAVGLFNTARSYWRSAEYLKAAQLKVTHPHAPVTFLYCHAIELYLKSYLRGIQKTVSELKEIGHRVANLAEAASKSGLAIEAENAEVLSHIDDADVAIESRYIVTGFKNLPTNEALSNAAAVLDQTICRALIKKGFAVRAEEFTRPEPSQQQKVLSDDTFRVLVYLFRVDNQQHREIRVMARALQLEENVLRFHLDRLQEANLAETVGFNYVQGDVYWDLTSDGRRYVMEHI